MGCIVVVAMIYASLTLSSSSSSSSSALVGMAWNGMGI